MTPGTMGTLMPGNGDDRDRQETALVYEATLKTRD